MLFDFHDTLVHLVPSGLDVVAAELGIDAGTAAAGLRAVDERLQALRAAGAWPPPLAERWPRMYALLIDLLGHDADAVQVAERLAARYRSPASYGAFADAAPVLRQLAASGVRIGVVSNSDFDLWPVLHAHGMADSVQVAVPVLVHGVEKPDPAAFALALDELGADPSACWFVGDHPEEDAAASDALGMTAVLVDRTGLYAGDATAARFPTVADLTPLPAMLAGRR